MEQGVRDKVFMAMATNMCELSRDDSHKYGAMIVKADSPVVCGCNGIARGVCDDREIYKVRYERPEKYFWFEHAERNAIYNAARIGVSTEGSTMYIQNMPCADCARAIIQSGIIEVVLLSLECSPRWIPSCSRALYMFVEAGVALRLMGDSSYNSVKVLEYFRNEYNI